jgi:hypothetical protein
MFKKKPTVNERLWPDAPPNIEAFLKATEDGTDRRDHQRGDKTLD